MTAVDVGENCVGVGETEPGLVGALESDARRGGTTVKLLSSLSLSLCLLSSLSLMKRLMSKAVCVVAVAVAVVKVSLDDLSPPASPFSPSRWRSSAPFPPDFQGFEPATTCRRPDISFALFLPPRRRQRRAALNYREPTTARYKVTGSALPTTEK